MTFDLDDTLYDNYPVIARLEQKMMVWMNQIHPITASRSPRWWSELKLTIVQDQPELKHDVTRWRFSQMKCGLELLGYDAPSAHKAAEQAMCEMLRLRNQISVPEETHRVLSILSQQIPLIAITNGNADPSRIGLGKYFKTVLKAGPDGFAKPFPDLFDKAHQILDVPRYTILHVGDHLVSDVMGAKQNGYSSCWFNDQRQTLTEAKQARILPDLEVHELADLITLV
jgi:FMN hydrolase / 5-amino-6-(5-phospho-D-ribitylamino)uracil phosphatase